MGDVVVDLLAVAGALMVLLAGLGVVRFPDLYARMHAATKASTIGIGFIGIAAATDLHGGSAKVAVAVGFIFFTAPCAAHFIGRVAYRAEGVEVDLATRDDLADLVDEP
jgi:multicomponent Na+:H+ antiporter subunit G